MACSNPSIEPTAALARWASRSVFCVGCLLGVAGCNQDEGPTYTVTGTETTTTNACGAGVDAPNPLTVDVQMQVDGSTLNWNWPQTTELTGPIVGSTATLTSTETQNVDGTNGVNGPCNMVLTDTIDVTLGSGSPPSAFTGTLTYSFAVEEGSQCSDQLSINGGMYDVLPCTIAYSLSGSEQ